LVQVAQAGNAVLIFPQGLHARPEQERQNDPAVRFRPGVAHLAEALDAPVVPFGLAGTDIIMPHAVGPLRVHEGQVAVERGEGFQGKAIAGIPVSLKRGPHAIAFGAPLRRGADEQAEEFTERLQVESYRLTRLAEQALVRADGANAS
jgi:1-acyl-sn-glycerol-3-phosphate acyltransferase